MRCNVIAGSTMGPCGEAIVPGWNAVSSGERLRKSCNDEEVSLFRHIMTLFLSFLCLHILHSPFRCFTWFHSFNFLCMCSMKPQNSSQDLLHHNSSCEHLHFWNLKCAAMRLSSWKGDPEEPLDLWFFVFVCVFMVLFVFFFFSR